jgi:hypothetical protein
MNRFLMRLLIVPMAVIIATVVSLIAVAFFILALFLFMTRLMEPPLAALVTGAIILIVAVLIVVIAQAIASPKRTVKRAAAGLGSGESAAAFGSLLGRKLHGYATDNMTAAALATLLLGIAVGYSPRLRNFLLDLLKK